MNETRISASVMDRYPKPDVQKIDELLRHEVSLCDRKIVVLDDDPTGVQTVHDISVYTDWSKESIEQGFMEEGILFYILTNSRGFTVDQTTKAHREIAANVDDVARSLGKDYLIISRGDSTLRGHYPLETMLLSEERKKLSGGDTDGEIICPYFKEGGRFTIDDVHYVKYGDELVPCGETEFAADETFGYKSSNLKEYVFEKTKGTFAVSDCKSVSLDMIRSMDYEGIENILMSVKDFEKVIVNAIDDSDVKVFATALHRVMRKGKNFTIRSAAALVKAIGGISDKPLLTRGEMVTLKNKAGGIIVVGSHTKKTTAQLEELKKISDIEFIEMNSDLVLEEGALLRETERVLKIEEECIKQGKTVCVSTKRTLLKVENDTPEAALVRSVEISDALQSLVGKLEVTPAFVVAKGGITSSDVGTKALKVKKAKVLGQIQPGIPVWQTGAESRFPGTPYVIFPGNVGDIDTLYKAVKVLI
ncbi:MAG: hydroxyacid dehydrogenase [Lachnospiraceae bacterium]|nr:hydroxyacid dehydrogenase [Lachnospiraceae bacterium]